MSSVTLTWPSSLLAKTLLCSWACSCCSWRRSTSLAVLTSVLKAFTSSGLGFFLVAAHGPRADQRRLRLAVLDHGHGPALVLLVLDHARGKAIALPHAGFLDGSVVVGIVGGFGEIVGVVVHAGSR